MSDLMAILVLGNEQTGMQPYWPNHGSTASIVWLQIQDFGKTPQRHSVNTD